MKEDGSLHISLLVPEAKSIVFCALLENGIVIQDYTKTGIKGDQNKIGHFLTLNIECEKDGVDIEPKVANILDNLNISHFGYLIINRGTNKYYAAGGNISRKDQY